MKAWFAEKGRPVYACGPYLPLNTKITANSIEKAQSANSEDIQTFLDDALNAAGKQSVLYVNARYPLPMRIHPLTTSCDYPDIIWVSLLACQVTPEPLGVPRRRHGTDHSLCGCLIPDCAFSMPLLIEPLLCLRSALRLRASLLSRTRSKTRSNHTGKDCCRRGHHSN